MSYGTRNDDYPASSKLLHWPGRHLRPDHGAGGNRDDPSWRRATQDALYNSTSRSDPDLILMTLRLINRLAVGAPIADPEIEPWQKAVSAAVHTSF